MTRWNSSQKTVSAQRVEAAAAAEFAKSDPTVQFLRDHTPEQCEAFVQNNVTDLASARALMKKFAVILCLLAKRELR
jgi:hypothetical protein